MDRPRGGNEPVVTDLNALVLNCTLTPSPGSSSTELRARPLRDELGSHGGRGERRRGVAHARPL